MIKAIVERPARGRLEQAAQSLFEQVSDAVLIANAGGVIRSANPAAATMFDTSREALVGCAMTSLVSGCEEQATSGTTMDRAESTARRSDGTTFPVQLSLRFVDEGEERYSIITLTDLSALKNLELRLHAAQKMEAVGLLAGGVAHDFNNLLMIVAGYCETLRNQPGWSDTQRSGLESIAVAADQAASLTGQLLALSRPAIAEPDVIDLHAALVQTRKLLDRTIGEDISIDMPLAPAPLYVRMNRSDVGQILINLAFNARDAMPEGGAFTVSTRTVTIGAESAMTGELPPGDYVELTVKDTGTGMAAETRARAFEPFFTTKSAGRGTGLGLATVARIVQQCGGGIRLDTAPGRGTTFAIFLPVQTQDRTAADLDDPQAPPRGSETALVVEDDREVREIVATMLRDLGYDVVEAAGFHDAITAVLAEGHGIELLVTDVMMPEISGPELADRIRQDVPDVKVLFMSGYSEDDSLSQSLDRASVSFIRKPFTRLTLARCVRQVLDAADPVASALSPR